MTVEIICSFIASFVLFVVIVIFLLCLVIHFEDEKDNILEKIDNRLLYIPKQIFLNVGTIGKFVIIIGLMVVTFYLVLQIDFTHIIRQCVNYRFSSKDSVVYSYNVVNTVSGIVSPFLTFIALCVAYRTYKDQNKSNKEALEKQNQSLNEQKNANEENMRLQNANIKEQNEQFRISLFENHLFQMIDQQHKLEERIIAKHGSFRDLYNQFCYIYEITKEIMTEIKVEDKIKDKIKKEKNESGKEIKNEEVEKEGKEEFKNKTLEIAYYIFYFGVDRDFVCDQTGKNIEEYFSKDFAKKLFEKLNLAHGWFHNQKSEELGIYYRNLFNAIWYIDHKCPVDDREKKEEYAKLMRTNISDFAQLMLYYNMQGKRGKAWLDDSPKEIKYPKRKKSIEEGKIDVQDCLLTRYFPIKNCAIGLENLDIDPRSDGRKNLFSNEVIDYELKL